MLFLCPVFTCARMRARVIRYARMYVRAILSRFKRLLRLEWYQYTTYGRYAFRMAVRCLSVPPLVVCGVVGVAWVCVWAWFVRPLIRTEARPHGCGAHMGALMYARVPAQACSHTCIRLCLCLHVRPYAQTCAHIRLRSHPRMRPRPFGYACAHVPIYI